MKLVSGFRMMDHQGVIDSMSTFSQIFVYGIEGLFVYGIEGLSHMDILFGDTVSRVSIYF